jgi:hypothetical protein
MTIALNAQGGVDERIATIKNPLQTSDFGAGSRRFVQQDNGETRGMAHCRCSLVTSGRITLSGRVRAAASG